MKAKIVTEKIVLRGEKCRKIVKFEGIMSENDLPNEYNNNGPRFYMGLQTIPLLSVEGTNDAWVNAHWFGPGGEPIPEVRFQTILLWMRRAGARLAKINRRLAAENAGWLGEETVEI